MISLTPRELLLVALLSGAIGAVIGFITGRTRK